MKPKLPADYHMHTPLCLHAQGEPSEYAARAVQLGFEEIGFSDHSPMKQDDFDNWRMRADQLDEYVEGVRKARRDHPNLIIKLALEVDYFPNGHDWIQELSGRHPWDYLIGSVHYVSESWAIDDPQMLAEWRQRDPGEVWRIYFERLTMAAESGFFDIIGHADLCKKFSFRPEGDCSPLYDRFLTAAHRTGTAIELNTSGLRKACREIYPSREILERAFRAHVAITFGSDAHAPQEVGQDFDRATTLAQSVGFTHWQCFTARQSTAVGL